MDTIDERILTILRRNARASLREIADQVNLSPAPVKRRIERLERSGVIIGYRAVVDYGRHPSLFEAFTEIRIPGNADIEVVLQEIQRIPEVEQVFAIAGDPDALVRIRADHMEHLQQVVNQLRKTGLAQGTKTMIVMQSWQRS